MTGPDTAHLASVLGPKAFLKPLTTPERMGRRVNGVDLSRPLSPAAAEALVALVDHHHLVSFPDQDGNGFTATHLERVANHFGSPIPHPYNYANYAEYVRSGELLRPHPVDECVSARVNAAFPDVIECVEGADSPAVYIVTNLLGSGAEAEPVLRGGQHWHTDIEFQPIPLSTSMFYVQQVPTNRLRGDGTWVTNPSREPGFYHPDSAPELAERREALPLNGETAYTDTADAYASLGPDERRRLDEVMVRRRRRPEDPGWLRPLVYSNPRTGRKSLHSPVWASRGKRIAPVEVDGLDEDASRGFLDELEAHCLQERFRYDHPHTPGDVTIWSNFATMHTAPPSLTTVNDPADARLLYRISCKGEPCHRLPRRDADAWIDEHIEPPYRSPIA